METPSTPPTESPGLAASPEQPEQPELEARLRQRMARPLAPPLQKELSRMLHLRVAGASALEPPARHCVELALEALLAEEPNLHLVRGLRRQLESHLADKVHPLCLAAMLRTGSLGPHVLLGLAGSLLLTLTLALAGEWLRLRLDSFKLFNHVELHLLLAVALTGILGSVTSILVRVGDFEQADNAAPASRVLLGFSKPLVGAAFALFGLLLLKSRLLPLLNLPPEGQPEEFYLFLALSFALGFSERLAQDMVAQVEQRFEPQQPPAGQEVHSPPPQPVSTGGGESPKS